MREHPLLGTVTTDRDAQLLRLRVINDALVNGMTWAQVARVTGSPDGKALKNETKKLARRLERELRAETGRR